MRVLFLTHRLPYAPNRGDRIRAYFLLREMSRFAEVSLFSLVHDDAEAEQVRSVPFAHHVTTVRVTRRRNLILGAVRLGSNRPLTHSLLDAPDARAALARVVRSAAPDVIVASCSSMARFAMEPPLEGRPFVLDMVDVDSEKWRQLADGAQGLRRWVYRREAATLRTFEAEAASRATMTLVVNEREKDVMLRIAPQARVCVASNGVETVALPPAAPSQSPTVIFCGVMNYFPNEDGVRWFAEAVWPRVRAARPDARFVVVGASPSASVQALARADSSIEVTGSVLEVQPYLWRAAISVAPLRLARGVQNKVLEALASGLPVVATASVIDGLPLEARAGCVQADEPGAFADAVLRLLAWSPAERRQFSAVPIDKLTWRTQLAPVEGILRGV